MNFSDENFAKTAQIQFVNDFADFTKKNAEFDRNDLELESNAATLRLRSIDNLNIWVRSKVAYAKIAVILGKVGTKFSANF